ncbi:MAG: hypothetical protein KDC95_05145 [Planctomycetes bacterium]|nr:hypothetical protein [Planctomycetota bacterium]
MNQATLEKTDEQETKLTQIALPHPKVELPEVPYDKDQLPEIRKLDTMIIDCANLRAAVEIVSGRFERMKQAASTSCNGTATEQIAGLMKILDAIDEFDNAGVPLAKLARKAFMSKHASDDEFSSCYRETYSAAEEGLEDKIADHKTRRAVVSVMMNEYRYTPRTNLDYLEQILSEAQNARDKAIEQVVSGAETDMMVADFKKGRALVDLLQSTRNKLTLVRRLDPKSEKITAILEMVDAKEKSRQKEIAEARESTRFPERYSATNAPKDAAGLEESMRSDLEHSGFQVEKVCIASSWIAVHSPLGVHLYNQIDFHVAVHSSIEEEARVGVLDILYVTGKTGTPKLTVPFARRSTGRVGQMLKSNL